MASLEDLPIKSILEESTDEAIERLRQIRLARRTPVKAVKVISSKAKASAVPKVSAEQAAKLLELLEGEL
jgi:DNA-binding TFAR19-related protein (PDSD5 family)